MNTAVVLAIPLFCRHFIAPLKSAQTRAVATIVACTTLIYLGCFDLEPGNMKAILTCSLCWMVSIRLFHKTVWTRDESFIDFILGFFWFAFPIIKNKQADSSNSSWISSLPFVFYHLLLALIKLTIVNFIYKWILFCFQEQNITGPVLLDNYVLTLQYVFLFFMMTFGTVENDIQIAIVSFLSKDKYRVLEFNNWPFLSKSPREFWGKRYNLLVNSLLRESIFQPLQSQCGFSKSFASLAAFTISGILHAHVSYIGFHYSNIYYAALFFIIQGLACVLEDSIFKKLPSFISWFLTITLLLLTSPLYPAFFVYEGPTWMISHLPNGNAFFTNLPVPGACPLK